MNILTINNSNDGKFLRKKTADFDFSQIAKNELRKLLREMRRAMKGARGIGLSANQIGINSKFFVAEVNNKFYAILNPTIEKESREKAELEEGCLSVPGIYGMVTRSQKITISGFDINNKKIKIKAWGLLAQVFQHEMDHLNGKLFIDRTKNVYQIAPES